MKFMKKRKMRFLKPVCMMLLMAMFVGCGESGQKQNPDVENSPDTANTADAADAAGKEEEPGKDAETAAKKEGAGEEKAAAEPEPDTAQEERAESEEEEIEETFEPLSEEELAALQYIEKALLDDYYGDKSAYDIFVPKETDVEDGFAFYSDHGLSFNAMVFSDRTTAYVYETLDYSVEYELEDWQAEDSEYTDVKIGEVKKNGDDRYQILTAKREDFYGTPYEIKKVFYLHIVKEGVGVFWELEMSEMSTDEETDLIIDELARCYCISLDKVKAGGSWFADDKERMMLEQDVYEPEEGDNVLEKVEGYQYMGLTTLVVEDKDVECPVMVPMGWRTYAKGNHVRSTMHGVVTSGSIDILMRKSFGSTVDFYSDVRYNSALEDTERNRHVQKSGIRYIPGFDEAACVVVSYEAKDYITQEYAPQIEILCYIRIEDSEYYLDFSITLKYDEYDAATNTVIKELETAYGIDLSEYYNEKE